MKQRLEACQFVWAANRLDIMVTRGDGQHRPITRGYSARYDDLTKLLRLINLGSMLLNGIVLRMAYYFHERDWKLGH